jgi:hypothetical protein
LQIKNCPQQYIGQDTLIQFKRGQNDLKTDNAKLDTNGQASFNEKIEMKTSIKDGEAKNSTILACVMN